MNPEAKKDAWVEIQRIVIRPGDRVPQLPVDTQRVPLEMRVKGHLAHDAHVGNEVEIVTPAGRRVTGTLVAINPEYSHRFGPPIPEMSAIGRELRVVLQRSSE